MVINLNKKMNEILNQIDIMHKPNLFLHVCCGPCSTAVLYKLSKFFNIYILFYNPNIDTKDEFNLRLKQLKNVLSINNYDIKILYYDYNHNEFLDFVKGLDNEPEGGKRCEKCFYLRLSFLYDFTSKFIKDNNMINDENYICTTLSISPHKNAELIEKIGEGICNKGLFNIKYLPSDFKKENGYLNSIKFSKRYGLYRQNYCGCEFSK